MTRECSRGTLGLPETTDQNSASLEALIKPVSSSEWCPVTCRRSNGYFIYATVEGVSFQPRDVPIGPLEVSLVTTSKGSIHPLIQAPSCWGRQNLLAHCLLPSKLCQRWWGMQGTRDLIPGLEEALVGMKPGAKRRAMIPPQLGYSGANAELQPQPPTFATKRQLLNHSNEALLFEVQLLKIRG